MTKPSESQAPASPAPVRSPTRRVAQADPDPVRELLQAERDFESGDYIELTLEQLEHCAATGGSPWRDESHS